MASTAYAELELGLHRWSVESYSAELRFSQPAASANGASDAEIVNIETVRNVQLDVSALRALALDSVAYGRLLTGKLFANPRLHTAFAVACTRAQEREVDLRLRLFIGPSAPELHGVRWETLQDPRSNDDSWLVSNEHILFSRYLSSQGYFGGDVWKRVRLRPRSQLSALVMIANPRGLGDGTPGSWDLPPLDVEAERERAVSGLGDFDLTVLASDGQATLDKLKEHVRQGCDVLYLACHGALVKGEARLWLEDEEGNVALVDGDELVASLRDLPQLPRLVVLASCQSSGTGHQDPEEAEVLHAMGPRLAEVGIPAVLAMQGNFTMETAHRFLPTFFAELQRDGQIDRAMAAARGVVRTRPDSWMPVLFMRLRAGRLWYAPGFGGDDDEFRKWPALLASIRNGSVTPILGPGLTDQLLGTRREIAQEWAKDWEFPLAPHDRDDLPQVAQYVQTIQNRDLLASELEDHLKTEIERRYAEILPPELHGAPLVDLHSTVFAHHRKNDPAEPHHVLAQLPFKIYITTSLGNALSDALRAEGKDPQVVISRWNWATDDIPSIYESEPGYQPSVDRPLVYHVFGCLEYRDSVVLTEDDYFDYLIGLTERRNDEVRRIPPVVQRALANSGLLFIGFQVDDWTFRVLFRTILSQEGGGNRNRKTFSHVAVQVEPEEDSVLSPKRAKAYFEEYFSMGASISVFWGSVEDFARGMLRQQQEVRR